MDRKKVKDTIIGIVVIAVLATLVVVVYNYERNKVRRDLARQIAELSPRGGPPETIEGLRTAIALYEAQIERNVQEGAQTGVYWKILGMRLADRGMHHDALDAMERAIHFNSSDPTLFYLTGEYASVVAASTLEFSADSVRERERLINLAESAYLRAIQLDPAYSRPRLGLGILYTFDLNRPAEAIPHMERFLELSPNNIQGMFVLARAFFMTENFHRALELYDRIIARTRDPRVRTEAENNKDIIWNMM